jgi:hypothetical protein
MIIKAPTIVDRQTHISIAEALVILVDAVDHRRANGLRIFGRYEDFIEYFEGVVSGWDDTLNRPTPGCRV